MFVAALEVDIDVVGLAGDGTGLGPVDFSKLVAHFIEFHIGVAQFVHDTDIDAAHIADVIWQMLGAD